MRSIVQTEELRLAQCGLDRNARRPYTLGQERRRDIGALAGAFTAIKRGHNRGIQADGGRVVAASGYGPGGRRASVARHRQQATSRPIRRYIESREVGIRAFLAETGEIRVDQTWIPRRDVIIFQLEFLAGGVGRINDEHVGPLDEPLHYSLSARSFQVECDAE